MNGGVHTLSRQIFLGQIDGIAASSSILIIDRLHRFYLHRLRAVIRQDNHFHLVHFRLLESIIHIDRDIQTVQLENKVVTSYDLTIDRSSAFTIGMFLFAVLPLCVLGAGFVVFLMRRKK